MCGIVGFKTNRDFNQLKESLPQATSMLIHRGPDDTGLFFDQESGVGLGHRRLSVIDLSESGRQPMVSDDGMVHIVYNGEIYNFKEIRTTLEEVGHHFRTETDTEVILKAYMEWNRLPYTFCRDVCISPVGQEGRKACCCKGPHGAQTPLLPF